MLVNILKCKKGGLNDIFKILFKRWGKTFR